MKHTKHVVTDQRDITIRDLRDRVAELEAQLNHGRQLVDACVQAERISARLVAWAGEPDPKKNP